MAFNTPSQICLKNCGLDPDIVCSSVNETLRKVNPRFASWFAVKQMISKIRRLEVVRKLSGSSLCEAACIQLLEYLTSPAGFHCRQNLTELYLPQNNISAHGLLAVSRFLRNNTTLRELSLYGNPLTADPDVVSEFASALNSSRLRTLLILDETRPGDPFLQLLVPKLAAPYLQHLRVATKCTQDIIPILVDYFRSPQCRLHRLDCKVSTVTVDSMAELLCAFGANVCLQHSELNLDIEIRISGHWKQCSRTVHADIQRNITLNSRVKDEAIALLRYSRALFLHSSKGKLANPSSGISQLPVELVQEILAYLAPSLSRHQRMRVASYAAEPNTLFPSGYQAQEGAGLINRLKILTQTVLGYTPPTVKERFGGKPSPCNCQECNFTTGLEGSCPRQRRWRMDTRNLWLTEVGCDSVDRPGVYPSAGRPLLNFKTPSSTILQVSYEQR